MKPAVVIAAQITKELVDIMNPLFHPFFQAIVWSIHKISLATCGVGGEIPTARVAVAEKHRAVDLLHVRLLLSLFVFLRLLVFQADWWL